MSLESGLTLITIGIPYVFSIMTLIIIICLILKKTFKRKAHIVEAKETVDEEQKLTKMEEINEEEAAAITSAVTAYMFKNQPPTERYAYSSGDKTQHLPWSLAGRMELMGTSVWREEKWGGNLRFQLERKRL